MKKEKITRITTVNGLIDELKKDDYENLNICTGSWAVLKARYEEYINSISLGSKFDDGFSFTFIHGMLCGLYAASYISESERDDILDSLLK